jgi:NCAIR mutase (PurE)-related protein
MDTSKIETLLKEVQSGQITVSQAVERLRSLPYADLGYAQVDLHRELRKGMPEVVFCQNKTIPQVIGIFHKLWDYHDRVMGTRLAPEMADALLAEFPEANYDSTSRLLTMARASAEAIETSDLYASVVSAGTADLPVAEEAAQTLEFHGNRVERIYDVGVAGIHRLLDKRERLVSASVVISVAGMEGALTSVVAGLVPCPVIGVPTSVGYGAHFGGLAPLLAMLNVCAPGVAVVNIDNGFGAAQFAHLILKQLAERKK